MTEDSNTIPTGRLIDWYQEEHGRFKMLRQKLNEMQNRSGPTQASQADIERIAGQVQGRAEILTSFAAFLAVSSADAAGRIEVVSFEE